MTIITLHEDIIDSGPQRISVRTLRVSTLAASLPYAIRPALLAGQRVLLIAQGQLRGAEPGLKLEFADRAELSEALLTGRHRLAVGALVGRVMALDTLTGAVHAFYSITNDCARDMTDDLGERLAGAVGSHRDDESLRLHWRGARGSYRGYALCVFTHVLSDGSPPKHEYGTALFGHTLQRPPSTRHEHQISEDLADWAACVTTALRAPTFNAIEEQVAISGQHQWSLHK